MFRQRANIKLMLNVTPPTFRADHIHVHTVTTGVDSVCVHAVVDPA